METKNKRLNNINLLALIIGGILVFINAGIFEKTMMPEYIPLGIMIVVGIVAKKQLLPKEELVGFNRLFVAYSRSIVSWGSIVCAFFMLTNYYIKRDDLKQEEVAVIYQTKRPKQKYSKIDFLYLTVDYHGQNKTFTFGPKYVISQKKYKKMALSTQKGAWGYPIIIDKRIVE